MWFLWKFRKYAIKDHKSGQNLKLRLCDTRGLEEDSSFDPQDIVYILDGNVPDRYQVHAYKYVVAILPWYLFVTIIFYILIATFRADSCKTTKPKSKRETDKLFAILLLSEKNLYKILYKKAK